jgi:hypothetical protein
MGTRDDSDEAYVVGLCNRILGENASPQHTFDWLLGDPGTSGRRAKLPVDAYWPGHQLVVEYRELQHDQPVPGDETRRALEGLVSRRGITRHTIWSTSVARGVADRPNRAVHAGRVGPSEPPRPSTN